MYAVLTAGVSPKWLETAATKGYDTGERNESTKIAASIQKMRADLKSYQNTEFHTHFISPDEPESWTEFVTLLKSRKWDCISYGGGVRTIPQLTDLFTELIHLAAREQPAARLIFPLLPEEVVPNLRKYLPEAN